MVDNFDGQWELNIVYTTTPSGFSNMEHRLTVDVNVVSAPAPGTDFADIDLTNRNLTTQSLETLTDLLVPLVGAFFSTTTDISRAELFFIEEGTVDKLFMSSYDIAAQGSVSAEEIPAQQATLTFRSINGGWGKIQMMEPVISGKVKISPPYTGAALALANHIVSPASPYFARDNSYFFSNLHYSLTENEKLMKKRYPR